MPSPYRSPASVPPEPTTLEKLLASARARHGVRSAQKSEGAPEAPYPRSAFFGDLFRLGVLLLVAGIIVFLIAYVSYALP